MPVITAVCALHKYPCSTYSSSEPFQTSSPERMHPESFCEQGRDLQGGNRPQWIFAMCTLIQMVCFCLKWKSWMFYWEPKANMYCACLLSVQVLSMYNSSFYAQSQVYSSLSNAALTSDNTTLSQFSLKNLIRPVSFSQNYFLMNIWVVVFNLLLFSRFFKVWRINKFILILKFSLFGR